MNAGVSVLVPLLMGAMAVAQPTVGVLRNTLAGADPLVGEQVAERLAAEQEVRLLAPEDLVSATAVSACGLVVLTEADRLPLASGPVLEAFLAGGGQLIALGAPLFAEPYAQDGERWVGRTQADRELRVRAPDHWIERFENEQPPAWMRAASDMAQATVIETQAPGAGGSQRCLHVRIPDLQGWDTFVSPVLEGGVPAGHTLTGFWVRGDAETHYLLAEWTERDGSRWLATVPLSIEWTRVVLRPEDFIYWESIPGRRGSRLQMADAERFSIGMALSHSASPGPHEFWIDELGTLADPWAVRGVTWEVAFAPRDGLYPAYKAYDCTDVVRLRTSPDQVLLEASSFPLPAGVRALHPRPQGTGYEKDRPQRWLPLIEALAPNGDWRGAAAALMLERETGALVASFAIRHATFYRTPAVLEAVAKLARVMREDALLLEAGATQYTYFADQPVLLGARVLPRGSRRDVPHFVHFTILDESGSQRWASGWTRLALVRDEVVDVSTAPGAAWAPEPNRTYRVRCDLVRGVIGDGVYDTFDRIDAVTHELAAWTPRAATYVTAGGGDFHLGEETWIPHGVNYMPSSGIAREDWEAFLHWLGRAPYGPEVIERDLARIAGLGCNMVSVMMFQQSVTSWNLLDLLRRCERHGLRANIALLPGTPMDFQWDKIREIIEANRLAEMDVVFAYDLAWEPSHGTYPARMRYAPDWSRFVEQRYGSFETAQEVWGVTLEVTGPMMAVPSEDQLYEEGDWLQLAADYRVFLDDLLAEHYGRARDLVRSVDDRHLVSFRMSNAGNPTYDWRSGGIPYDFVGLATAVDLMAPEGYGRMGDWRRVRDGHFTAAYARAVAPDLPVFWAEAGMSVWDRTVGAVPDDLLARQARFYEDFYRMLWESHSNGVAWWWYAGGFRVDENSDYGILNPDGTDRPVTRVIRAHAERIQGLGKTPQPDVFLDVDRRKHTTGLVGMYRSVYDEYWQLVEAGKRVGLRLAPTKP